MMEDSRYLKIEIKNDSITIPEEWHHLLMNIDIDKLKEPDFKFNKKNRKAKRIFRIIRPKIYYILNLKQNFYFLPKILHYSLRRKKKREVLDLPFRVINFDDFNERNTNLIIGGGYHSDDTGFALIFYLVEEKNFSVKMRYCSEESLYIDTNAQELAEIMIELENFHNLSEIPTFELEESSEEMVKKYLGDSISTLKDSKDIIISPAYDIKNELGVKRLYLPTFISILMLAIKLKREKGTLLEDPFLKEPIIYKILNFFFSHEKLSEPLQVVIKDILPKRSGYPKMRKRII